MRVVFLEDVSGVARGGDIKEVKNGFARNYLIPKKLAVAANHNALQRIAGLQQQAETTRLKSLKDMKALALELNGVRVDIPMRAGVNGRLYGSVTNALVADELSVITEKEIDRRTIEISDSIRQLGVFDVNIHLHPEVDATIQVLVHPIGTDPEAYLHKDDEQETEGEQTEDSAEDSETESDESPEPESDESESEDE